MRNHKVEIESVENGFVIRAQREVYSDDHMSSSCYETETTSRVFTDYWDLDLFLRQWLGIKPDKPKGDHADGGDV